MRSATRTFFLDAMRRSAVGALALAVVTPVTAADVTFVEVTDDVGLTGIPVGSAAWGDYDNDGDEDLLVAGRYLYRNEGPPTYAFSDVTAEAGLGDTSVSRGVWGDYDNDGWLDIYAPGPSIESNPDPNRARLYRNRGDGTFVDRADLDGDGLNDHVSDEYNSTAAAWGDADGDGFIDLYVGNYEWVCTNEDCGRCYPDYFWMNDGDGTFTDRSTEVGLRAAEQAYSNQEGPGLCARGVSWADFDNDGDSDVFVSNYRLDPNFLLINDGNANFTDGAQAHNADGDEDSGVWGHVLGAAWGDMDNDGDLDLYTANLAHDLFACAGGHDVSQALRSSGGSGGYTFEDTRLPVTAPANGMWGWSPCDILRPQPDFAETCPAWADYDNDGDLDLYISQIYTSSSRNRSHLYANDGTGDFTDRTEGHGPHIGTYQNYTTSWVDYDNDGDLDLLTEGSDVLGESRRMRLYRNEGGETADWLVVRVRGQATTPGTGTNTAGIGVRVSVLADGVTRIREVEGGHGYHAAQNSLPVEFGLGSSGVSDTVDAVDVRWTDGTLATYQDVPRNQRLYVYEHGVEIRRGTDPSEQLPVLEPAVELFPYRDPTLHDPGSAYYRVATENDVEIYVDKDPARGDVVIRIGR